MRVVLHIAVLISIIQVGLAAENISLILSEIEKLRTKSLDSSPMLNQVRALQRQKMAETFTRFSEFTPQASLSIRKEKDFFEERNVQLRALGLTPMHSSWGINYQWSLINYGQIQNTRKTWNEKNSATLDLDLKNKEYPIAFTTNLLQHLLAKYKKAAVENSLKKAETAKKEAKLGFELGQKTKIDVLRSEANWVSLDSKKISYIDEEQSTKSKFLEFSGLEEKNVIFLNNLGEESVLELINALSLPASGINPDEMISSPLLTQIELEQKINALSLSQLSASQLPDIKIQGSYLNSADSLNQTLHSPYRTHTVALVLTIPIFGGGNLISSHFEEYFALKRNNYLMEQKKLEVHNHLHNTAIKIVALGKMVNSLQLNVSQFEELYRLTQKSYQLGKSSLFELLEVQDNLLDSKINLAQTKINYYTLSQNYLWQAGIK